MSDSAGRDYAASVVAGGAAGLISTLCTNPLDAMRVRMSASREATGAQSKTLRCHVKMLFQDGIISGLRVGLSVNLLASVPSNAIYLSSYNFIRAKIAKQFGEGSQAVPVGSALGAVMMTNFTLAPIFTLRTRCQLDAAAKPLATVRSILQSEGPRGFYRGCATNVAGRWVEEGTFWLIFENLKRATNEGKLQSGSLMWGSMTIVVLSSVSKMIGSALSYPYNVVMTHLREVDKATGKHNHHQIMPTIRFIYAKDGVAGFYKGLLPHLLRCVVSKAAQIYAFEMVMFAYLAAARRYDERNAPSKRTVVAPAAVKA